MDNNSNATSYICQNEINFAVAVSLGKGMDLKDSQTAAPRSSVVINQTERLIAYVYGSSNLVAQANSMDGTAGNNSTMATINQTACNMAFAISTIDPEQTLSHL